MRKILLSTLLRATVASPVQAQTTYQLGPNGIQQVDPRANDQRDAQRDSQRDAQADSERRAYRESSRYWITNPTQYRLSPAWTGTRWIRVGNDALLVTTANGVIASSVRGLFY